MQVGPNELVKIDGFVEPERCSRWLTAAISNEEPWETRFDVIHSYGTTWYLEIEQGLLHYYHANAERTNQLLEELPEFISVMTKPAEFLTGPGGETGLPCRARFQNLGPHWAKAGIVLMDGGNEGQIHADYEGLAPYPARLFSPQTRAYSAVLCLAPPYLGGNLKIWKKRFLGNEEPKLEEEDVQIVPYAQGTMTVFDSFCYHRILASQYNKEKPYRAVAAIHFLYLEEPYPHWEHWF